MQASRIRPATGANIKCTRQRLLSRVVTIQHVPRIKDCPFKDPVPPRVDYPYGNGSRGDQQQQTTEDHPVNQHVACEIPSGRIERRCLGLQIVS